MINMTKAGEVGGFLDMVLLQIAENYEAEVKLRGKIKSAMTYPVVVFIIAILAVIGMLLFIVPVFVGLFADFGAQLPAATRLLVALSGLMKYLAPLGRARRHRLAVIWPKVKLKPRGARRRRPAQAQGARCSATCSARSRSPASPATSAR